MHCATGEVWVAAAGLVPAQAKIYTGKPLFPKFAKVLCCKQIYSILLQFLVKVVVQFLEIAVGCLSKSLNGVVFCKRGREDFLIILELTD